MARAKFFLWSIIIALILFASVVLTQQSIPYLAFRSNIDFLKTKQLIYHLDWWRISFYVHVFTSPLLLFTGLIQFIKYFIHKPIHKISGYIYIIVLIFFAGPSAFLMGLYANGGYPGQISFIILSLLWIAFTYLAFISIKKGHVEKHGSWLLRSYALTLSALTLRFYLMLFDLFNIPLGPIESYVIVAYASWIPNLVVSEILIRRGFVLRLIR